MAKDLTPTAVVRRPVEKAEQTTLFSKRTKRVGFTCPHPTRVYAGCKATVARSEDRTVILYAELPNMTLKLIYGGLETLYAIAGETVKEGAILGLGKGDVTLTATRLPDNEPVEMEFFADEPPTISVEDDTPPPPFPTI